ncbi:spindle assembly abnormal protein 6 homolog isoform X3 [Rhinatrema bivittatum]|uniref:spindle assembly abnormal protein 6 homolog isoform X3 n=1 Tax=Rhinatrema bivittatum TaxID=194408 RepID=UPI0011274083|nr:spindle assembly abnormal protein 6 homolog isoform X3 [Rhinatrema bivittatum]
MEKDWVNWWFWQTEATFKQRTKVRLTVSIHTTSNPIHKKDLAVQLSDDADPFFLYNLTIGEEDFQSLKNQQGLLVEFSTFPQRFIDLLEQCILENDKQVPRFLLQLVTSASALDCMPSSLNIIETNPFKHLTHLSLKLLAATDDDIKKYLATCIKNLKVENHTLEERLYKSEEELSKRLSITQQALAERSKELDKLQNEWTSQTSLLTNRHAEEIAAERAKALQIQAQHQIQCEQQKKEMETASNRTVHHLESRVSELETANKDLTERKYKSESYVRELKAKLAGLEEECQKTKQEVISLRRENSALDTECHEKEKLLNQLKTRTAVLEQEVKDKEIVVMQTADVCGSAQEHKRKLEGSLEQKRVQIVKLETTVKSLSEELLKANEIIKKLQTDLKKLMEKIKLKNAVTMQQEKLLGEKEQAMQKEKLELANVKQALQQKEVEALKLQEQLDITVQKLEESKQLLKTNENVISWLNKQLNETKITSLQGTSGQSDMPLPSVKSISVSPNLGAMQNGLPPFPLCNNPYFVSAVCPPVSSAFAFDNCSMGVTPFLRRNTSRSGTSAGRSGLQVHFKLPTSATSTPLPDSKVSLPMSNPLPSGQSDSNGLDMKYLKKNGSLPVQSQKPLNVPSTVPPRPTLPRQGSSATISAYFPGQQPRLPAS